MSETHLPDLIRDLAVILVAAGAVSFIFQKLKQPIVLGYLLVGYLVGPQVPIFPHVTSQPSIQVWAEIGVIFLLFSLGLDFSFRKLVKVGGPATLVAVIEIPLMLLLGFLTGFALGWSTLDSLFLGGMIAISSTSIILHTVEDLKLRSRQFVSLVLGVLVFEDLIAILLLVLLTTVSVTRQFAGVELAWASLRLLIFLVVSFVVGIFLLPGFVRRARAMWSDETTLIFAVGLCLLMVFLATTSGFSPALGAFMMGSILAETDLKQRIETLMRPLKHLFAAIFFVSVGMLFDPSIWIEQPGTVIAILLVTIAGKLIFPTVGALVAGQPIRTSVQTGMSLAQIGEFSFIIATLGQRLQVTSDHLYTIAVSVSVVTSFTTPYFIRHSDGFSKWLEERIPPRFKRRLKDYQGSLHQHHQSPFYHSWLKAYMPKVLINSAFIVAIVIACKWLMAPYIENIWVRFGIAIILTLPFFWGLVFGRIEDPKKEASLERGVRWLRVGMGLSLFVIMLLQFTSRKTFYLSLATVPAALILFWRFGEQIYSWLEGRVMTELDATSEPEAQAPLLPWDAHLTVVSLNPHSVLCGQSLSDVGFKESFGVLVTVIERSGRKVLAPPAETILYPYDQLYLVGTDEALERVATLLESGSPGEFDDDIEYKLFGFVIESENDLVGKSVRDSGLREEVGLIVGVERKGLQLLNPPSDFVFKVRDRIWIVGDPEKARRLKSH